MQSKTASYPVTDKLSMGKDCRSCGSRELTFFVEPEPGQRMAIDACVAGCGHAYRWESDDYPEGFKGGLELHVRMVEEFHGVDTETLSYTCEKGHIPLSVEAVESDGVTLICRNLDYRLKRDQFSPNALTIQGSGVSCNLSYKLAADKLPDGWILAYLEAVEGGWT